MKVKIPKIGVPKARIAPEKAMLAVFSCMALSGAAILAWFAVPPVWGALASLTATEKWVFGSILMIWIGLGGIGVICDRNDW